MSLFRRRGRDRDDDADAAGTDEAPDELEESDDGDELEGGEDTEAVGLGAAGAPARAGLRDAGPWDLSEVDDPAEGRVDLGGMWVPTREGLEIRVDADPETGTVVAVTVVMEEGALQLAPFAAPRSEGIWDEVRAEIRAGITRQGGTADESEGPFGTELRTKVPVKRPDGSSAVQPARFLGVDGPRWFLRGVLSGPPSIEEAPAGPLIDLFRDVVVVRGSEAMAPRDPIPLTLPTTASAATDETGEETSADTLNPFERGPEITEIR